MAGRKYVCLDCGREAWRPGPGKCIYCGSDNVVTEKQGNKKRCIVCGKLFVPIPGNAKICSDECRGKREKEKASERWRQKHTYKCKICHKQFVAKTAGRYVCYDPKCCAEKIRRDKEKERKRIEKTFDYDDPALDIPLYKMRYCHTCGRPTWDWNCERCRAKMRAHEGVTSLSSTGDLFAGGIIDGGIR